MGGICGSHRSETDLRISSDLRHETKEVKKTVKVLLLGVSNAGKSTLLRQLSINHGEASTDDSYKIDMRLLLRLNAIIGIKKLFRYCTRIDLSLPDKCVKANELLDNDGSFELAEDFSVATVQSLITIWEDVSEDIFEEAAEKYEELRHLKYLMEIMDRMSEKGYMPTSDDMLHARRTTVGIYSEDIHFNGYLWQCIDVGGQKSERRKWIHCFDNVDVLVYCVNLASFDEPCPYNKDRCILDDSLSVWKSILATFTAEPIVLVFNKVDLFKHKMAERKQSYKDTLQDIKHQFLHGTQSNQVINVFTTCALDSRQVMKHWRLMMNSYLKSQTKWIAEKKKKNKRMHSELKQSLIK